ncbi:MAG: alkaline phosphatase family protein, partial [Planctomycetes bacterium]|nr:alkaline phosphatase family protein [Planctomycetota bacterium]
MLFAFCALATCSKEQPGEPDITPPISYDGPERDVPGRVFLVGIDGATAQVFDPTMKAGLMPNLARLITEGSYGVLKSMHPTASAIVWTTIATGKEPD